MPILLLTLQDILRHLYRKAKKFYPSKNFSEIEIFIKNIIFLISIFRDKIIDKNKPMLLLLNFDYLDNKLSLYDHQNQRRSKLHKGT